MASMKIEQTANYKRAFKDADIRGVYPTEIDECVAYTTARAFVEEFGYKKVVVGYDMRLSTPRLKKEFIKGVREAGADVIDVGQVHSPLLYFASGKLNLPGAMITASHSPKEYNGIKLVEAGAVPLTGKTGLNTIAKKISVGEYSEVKKKGKLVKKNFKKEYLDFVTKEFDKKKYKKIKILADVGNGMSSVFIKGLDKKLPAKFDTLFNKLDGSFPNRGSDPCLSKNQKSLKAKLKAKNYDFGVGFDGDGDRIAFHDEKGRYINCAVIGALISDRLIKQKPKAGIVFTNLTSRVLEETIKENGGKAVRARVGHAFLKRKMRETGAVFGAEHSGHFFFKDFYNTDSVTLTLLNVLDEYAKAKAEGKTFSQMIKPYLRYEQTEDAVVHVKDKKLVMQKVEEKLLSMKPKKLTKFDGYFVDFGDVWGAVKPSVTEYAVKLMFEAKKKSEAKKVQKELLEFLKKVAKE